MVQERLKIPEIFSAINKFNESLARNIDNEEYANFTLRYCMTSETLHSFRGEWCYNCNSVLTPNLLISQLNFEEFKNYFGNKAPNILLNTLDEWIDKNDFPKTKDKRISSLPEHKKLEILFYEWLSLSDEEKVNELLDLYSVQKKYKVIVEESMKNGSKYNR